MEDKPLTDGGVRQRWAKPCIPLAVETDASRARWDPALDRWCEVIAETYRAEDIERIRQGYVCLKCKEPQEVPFPDNCQWWWCRYPMRTHQQRDFELEFDGERWIGPSYSLDDELARMDTDTHPRRIHVPGSQILVPRGVKL